jgi:hypothetical protein
VSRGRRFRDAKLPSHRGLSCSRLPDLRGRASSSKFICPRPAQLPSSSQDNNLPTNCVTAYAVPSHVCGERRTCNICGCFISCRQFSFLFAWWLANEIGCLSSDPGQEAVVSFERSSQHGVAATAQTRLETTCPSPACLGCASTHPSRRHP